MLWSFFVSSFALAAYKLAHDSVSLRSEVEDIRTDFCTIVVWDKDKIGKDFLGTAVIPTVLVDKKREPVELWIPLKGRMDAAGEGKKATLLKGAKMYMNAEGGRGEVLVVLTNTEVGNVSLDREASQNSVGGDDRETMTRTVLQNFRSAAEEKSAATSWHIPSEELEVESMLAEGTNAMVFNGLYRGQKVAIKVLKQALDPVQMKDFTHEFDLLSRLKSPWVVLFYGASINDETNKLSMVFEYCPHGSLQDVMKLETNRWDWDRFFRCAIQAVLGIASLHNWNPRILHRDVKSLNYLVDAFWNIKVADLGLARTQEDTNDATLKSLRGTFHYSPPEVYSKEEAFTDRSDVYSLAVVLWEMATRVITGQYVVPYAEHGFKFDFQIIIKVSKENLRPTLPKGIPEELKFLIEKCWDREKDTRLSASVLADALQKLRDFYRLNKDTWDPVVGSASPAGQPVTN